MAWGIPGNVGEIYRKQQDDELKNQLLQQEMAARMREADLRQQELSARIAEQRQMEAERAKAAERQTSLDLEKQLSPGAQTPAAAAVLRKYPATAARLSTARLDPAFGTPPIDVLAPNEKQAADATALKERNAALEQIAADPRLKTLVPLLRGGLLTSVPASAILPEEQKPDLKDLTVPGPGGQPIVKSFDAEQRAAGVPVYREPKDAKQPSGNYQVIQSGDNFFRVDRDTGIVSPLKMQEGGGAVPLATTADMRNKQYGRQRLGESIAAVETLSKKVITEKSAIAQRAKAAGRTVESALAGDPDFQTYQSARKAMAGNLAIATQGGRPSDADILAIWLPMIPDAFADNAPTAANKWKFIRVLSQAPPEAGTPPTTEGAPPPTSGTVIEYDTQGRRKPAPKRK